MRDLNRIILHCSATPEGQHYSTDTIRQWHLDRGWRDIGYHFVILLDGTIEEGRNIEWNGAHTRRENYDSIGVCYIGGVESERDENGKWVPKDTMTIQQMSSFGWLVNDLRAKYNENLTLHGHNEYSSKACPSFNVQEKFSHLLLNNLES